MSEKVTKAPKADPDAGLKKNVDDIRKTAKTNPENAINELKSKQANLRTNLGEDGSADTPKKRADTRAQLRVIEIQLLALKSPNLSTKQVVEKHKKIVKKREDMATRMFS